VKQPLPLPGGGVSDLAIGQALPAPSAWGVTRAFQTGLVPEVAMIRKSKIGGGKPDAGGGGVTSGGTTTSETIVTVTIQNVQTTGELSPAAVKRVLKAEAAKLAQCCQDSAKSDFMLPATVTLVFTVGTDGKVSADPVGKPPLASQGLERCLALRGLQFPSSRKASTQVTVTWPWQSNRPPLPRKMRTGGMAYPPVLPSVLHVIKLDNNNGYGNA
jgi:hypothetical protein